MYFFDAVERSAKEVAPGIRIRTHWGERMLISDVELDPNAVLPEHSHPHEQAGVMIQGTMTLTVEGETRSLEAGESYLIPGDVSHRAVAGPEGARVIDVFSPVREDYKY